MAYAPLWIKSHYSFLEGASSPEEYVDACHAQGLKHMAITDRDGVYGIVRAYQRAKSHDLHLIYGSEITLEDQSTLLLLVRDQRGYQNLCQLISKGRLRSPKGSSSVTWDMVYAHALGLIALWGGASSALVRPQPQPRRIRAMQEAFGDDLYALMTQHWIESEQVHAQRTYALAREHQLPLVANTEVLYHVPERRDLQDVMTCIRHGCTLQTAAGRTRINDAHALLSGEAFRARFADHPEWIAQSLKIAERCTFSLDTLRYVYPAEPGPEGLSPDAWLHRLTFEGAAQRYPEGIPENVRAQLLKELELIRSLDYGGYFLTMKTLVDFCRSRDILCQGRGSAANSAVCYCLGITAVDPVRMDLLFERFLSKERQEPPDIDLDIAHQRREEVIQYMYARYGRERAAMVANVIRYRPRSAVRDVGGVLGIADDAIERLSKLVSYSGPLRESHLQEAGLATEASINQHFLRLTNELLDAPRHLSIHPGGFILGKGPIAQLVPIENATMQDRTVIQWDKYDVEAMGLFKLDLLGLGALTHIDQSLQLIQKHHGQTFEMATLPPHCSRTFKMLQQADTLGVFQVESRAQISMLQRLKPREFYDLVVQISIVRPGPITGGMVHPYLRRRAGEEPIDYPHPSLEPVLKRTLGVPIFQEQVMKIAIIAADYTPGEADQLRRDMGAWRAHGKLERHRAKLIERMQQKGISEHFAQRVFEQIQGFGEYGFPESHAASFALIAWATAWIRCHYLDAFTCALLNAQPMGFYSVSTILQDARRRGLTILPVDIQSSAWDNILAPTLQEDVALYPLRLGFRQVQGISPSMAEAIEQARCAQPFSSFQDVLDRVNLSEGALLKLAKAGAFESLNVTRRDAIWAIRHAKRQETLPLFPQEVPANDVPEAGFRQLTLLEQVHWDYRQMHLSTQGHVLEPLRPQLTQHHLPTAQEIYQRPNHHHVRYAGLIIVRQRPSTAAGVVFLTMEDETGFVNVVIWPKVWEKYATFVRTHAFVVVHGRVQREHNVLHVIATHFEAPPIRAVLPASYSHDFH